MRSLLFVAVLMLAGCQRTLVESAPADAGCDPSIVGHWLSVGDGDEADGEIEAAVDATCALVIVEHGKDGDRTPPPTQLATATVGRSRVLWIDAAWANEAFKIESGALDTPGDLYLYGWTAKRDRLTLYALRHRALAEKVLEREIKGDLTYVEQDLAVRLRGDREAIASLVKRYRVFDTESPLRFRRATKEDAR